MHFDTLILNATVVDGSKGPKAVFEDAAVGIRSGRIAAVDRAADLSRATAREAIDAAGKVVAPGFIDVHIHSEIALISGDESDRYGALKQGVTTHLLAPDGFGWTGLSPDRAKELWQYTLFCYGKPHTLAELFSVGCDAPARAARGRAAAFPGWVSPEEYLALFPGRTPANVVPQAPHCAIRLAAMGWEPRPAEASELETMRRETRAWMEAGAVGIALGLDYQPSASSDTRELVELCKVVREYGGIYAAHVRYLGLGRPGAWRETMEIGEKAGIPVHISHEFVTDETAPLLEEAEKRCDLTFESYVYPAGCTHLTLTLPLWAQAGGPEAVRRRLKDKEARRRMAEALEEALRARLAGGGDAVFAANQTGRYIGMGIAEAARLAGKGLGEFALEMLEEEDPYALMIYHHEGGEERHRRMVRDTYAHPRMIVASDGVYHGARPHPRAWGCFARALRLAVRELGVLSLGEAVHKMSGFPAERFGIKDRGFVREGYGADLVIFDPDAVRDEATWEEPRREPAGIERVMVNGEWVIVHGRPTGKLPGQVLRR